MPAMTQERQEQAFPGTSKRPASGIAIDPARLAWYRDNRGWSRQDLSRAVTALGLTAEDGAPLTVSRDAIAKIESGEHKPKGRTLRALCEALSRERVPQFENGVYTGDVWELAERVWPRDLMPGGPLLPLHEETEARNARLAHNQDLREFAVAWGIRYRNPVSGRVYYSRPLRDAYALSVAGAPDAEVAVAAAKARAKVQAEAEVPGDAPASGLDERDMIAALDLTVRTHNCLHRQDIDLIGQLTGHSAGELLGIRNFGVAALAEVRVKLSAAGFALRGEEPPADSELLAS